MPAIIVRDIPEFLHRSLVIEAANHHRSVNREVIAILEKQLVGNRCELLPPPIKGKRAVSPEWIVKAIRKSRDSHK